jgi:hypothetical protein
VVTRIRYIFLTACRNEEAILDDFLREFTQVVHAAGVARDAILFVVDDYSTDRSEREKANDTKRRTARCPARRQRQFRIPDHAGG